MEKVMVAVAVLVVIAAICGFVSLVDASNQRDIRDDWAARNGYAVVSSEATLFDTGPFYYRGKGQSIYRIVVNDHGRQRVFYMRTSLLGDEYEEYH